MARFAILLLAALCSGGCGDKTAPPAGPAPGPGSTSGPAADRAGWVVAQIEAWNAALAPADRAAKYCKMAASPSAFYRGTNHLFWADFAADPRLEQFGNPSTRVWLQGDLHPQNYGAFLDDEGRMVFALNDFDDSMVADYQYDLWRMAAGIVLAVRSEAGLDKAAAAALVDGFVDSYLDAMHEFRDTSDEKHFALSAENASAPVAAFLDDAVDEKTRELMLDKWTDEGPDGRRFDLGLARLEAVSADARARLIAAVPGYGETLSGGIDYDPARFRVLDVARRVGAGIGSLGVPRYYLLIDGPTEGSDDDVILDVKRQSHPTGYYFLAAERPVYDAAFSSDARRHVVAMKALSVDTDDYLGELRALGADFSVRERSPGKESLQIADLDPDDLGAVAGDWGLVLAASHARADVDFDPSYVAGSVDAAVDGAAAGKRDALRALVREVAFTYADRVAADYEAFLAALEPRCD